jgi:GNAT superfamily N-acetyltransferase
VPAPSLDPFPVTFRTVEAESVEAGWALAEYFNELDRRFVGGFDAAAALAEASSSLNPPAGQFVIATIAEDIVACGAIQWVDATTAEIKRMWVDPDRRGIGLGKRLLGHLESEARLAGRARVVLDTNRTLAEAIAMYRRLDYQPIERYNDNPYAHHWFEKLLA